MADSAYNVPGPRMARPALSGAHRLGGRREHNLTTKLVRGKQWEGAPQAGDSTVPAPAARSHAQQVHRVMGRRVAGIGLGGRAEPDGGHICRAEKRRGDLLGRRQGSRS